MHLHHNIYNSLFCLTVSGNPHAGTPAFRDKQLCMVCRIMPLRGKIGIGDAVISMVTHLIDVHVGCLQMRYCQETVFDSDPLAMCTV